MKPTRSTNRSTLLALLSIATSLFSGGLPEASGDDPAPAKPKGIAIQQLGAAGLQRELAQQVTSAPVQKMRAGGLAAATGAARVRVTAARPQEVTLPIPQLVGGQVPVCFVVHGTPPDAVTEFRLRSLEGGTVLLEVSLVGKKQEVQIAWSAVVLLTPHDITPDRTPAPPYQEATACVQAQADEIQKLADQLWPLSKRVNEFAANIQRHIREMKRTQPPRSLDAMGILRSGENGICTANANLACALMRSKGVACRSVAVLPPISQRLEMHRIVEFFESDRWVPFDPSSLSQEIPAQPWQNIVMAKTTTRDEQSAMKPRMGAMVGCPYGQEIELLTSGVNLFGQDFFWTQATPLAEFVSDEAATRLAAEVWSRYLKTGTCTSGQMKARSARTAAEFVDALTNH